MSVPLPARLYGPGEPLPATPSTNADATSSSCTSWNGVPGSGSTGFRIGIDLTSDETMSGSASFSRKYGISSSSVCARGPATMHGPERPGMRARRLHQHLAEHVLDLGLLLGVEVLARAARLDVLGQPVRVVVVEAVGGDARRVTDALGARLDRGLEHGAGAVDVDRAGRVARAQDRERQVDYDVGALHGVADALLVLHVALAVLDLLPALVLRVELAARHADDLLDSARALERVDECDA